MDSPLLEEDFPSEGVIEPARAVPDVDMPERAVLCFFGDVVNDVVVARPDAHQVTALTSEVGLTSVLWHASPPPARGPSSPKY